MTETTGGLPVDVKAIVAMDGELSKTLQTAADQLNHADSLDEEQRAEIYAILKALKDRSTANRVVLADVVSKLSGRINRA